MGRKVLRRGSKKGLSRRPLEGGSTPFREYHPLRLRPTWVNTCRSTIQVELLWGTDFYTPPVLRGAALVTIQRQRCIKLRVLREQDFLYTPLVLNCQKGQDLPALEVYKNQSPMAVVNP